MRLTWPHSDFICKELYTPFVLERDVDYLPDLRKKYNTILKQAQKASADEDSIKILTKYKNKVIEALTCYYRADTAKCNIVIRNLVRDIGENPVAVSSLANSYVFAGDYNAELQLFRSRIGNPSNAFTSKEMSCLPKSLRAKSGNYRFSIPGNPSLYLANSSYGCWVETGYPPESEFNVSPVLLDGTQKIFNLAVQIRDVSRLNDWASDRVHCWLKLLMLSIATSYRINEAGRTFKSEYIISQSIMMACKRMGYDGGAYYSKRVADEAFSRCAINLALFIDYSVKPISIEQHMKIDDSFNYALYKQLYPSLKYKEYDLRSVRTGFITNIGSYDRQYPYNETYFFDFDKFLFTSWRDKPNGKGKDEVEWGDFAK